MSCWTVRHEVEEAEVLDGTWVVNGILTVEMERDKHYGADADGNRGMDVTGESCRDWTLTAAGKVDDDGTIHWLASVTLTPQDVIDAAQRMADTLQPDDEWEDE